MGKETVIYSDYDGREIGKDTPASTITIETPGQDTITFEAYLNERDLESIQQLPIADGSSESADPSQPSTKTTKLSETPEAKKLYAALDIDDAQAEALRQWYEKLGWKKKDIEPKLDELEKLVDDGKFSLVSKPQFKLVRELYDQDRGKYRNSAVLTVLKAHLEPSNTK